MVRKNAHTLSHTHTHTFTHAHTFLCTCIHTHTHTFTHTQPWWPSSGRSWMLVVSCTGQVRAGS